jgi:predicted nucleotidyltransferase
MTKVKKVTIDQVQEAVEVYARRPTSMRLGQFLMSRLKSGESCSEVYYEENNITAMNEFIERFVD